MSNYGDIWTKWLRINEDLLNMWGRSSTQNNPQPARPDKAEAAETADSAGDQNPWEKYMLSFYSQWFDFSKEMFKTFRPLGKEDKAYGPYPFKDLQEMLTKGYQGYFSSVSVKETFERIIKSTEVYNKLYEFWLEQVASMPGKDNITAWEDFRQKALENYMKIAGDFSNTFMPEQFKSFVSIPNEIMRIYHAELTKLFGPWIGDSGELQKDLLKSLHGDRAAYARFQKEWSRLYETTFDKFLHIPATGSNRESINKAMKSLDALIHYNFASSEFMAALNKIGMESMEKVLHKIGQMAQEDKVPESFLEFYKIWAQTHEEALLELFNTESFSKMLGQTVDAGLRFKNGFDDLLQEQLAILPIPTRKEIDSLEKTVYIMKKTLKQQSAQINEIMEKLNGLSGGK